MTKGRIIAIVLVLAVAGGAFWASRNSSETHISLGGETGKTVAITYQVHGSASKADLTYKTATGTGQQSGVNVPVTRKSDNGDGLTVNVSAGSFVSISAQNAGQSGDLECIILGSKGQVISDNRASGAFAIASCEGDAS
jgi:hypothetical protein